jgi:hypothetical protein
MAEILAHWPRHLTLDWRARNGEGVLIKKEWSRAQLRICHVVAVTAKSPAQTGSESADLHIAFVSVDVPDHQADRRSTPKAMLSCGSAFDGPLSEPSIRDFVNFLTPT